MCDLLLHVNHRATEGSHECWSEHVIVKIKRGSFMIEIQRQGNLMEIKISRPQAKNALTLEMYETMTAALAQAAEDETTRVVLICGGEGVFTSGNDLTDFMQDPPEGFDSPVFRFLKMLVSYEKPVIAAVDGWAVGIGTTLLLHCDLAFASTRAKFQMPFVNLALVPEAGASLILPGMMGHQKAMELLLLSKKFDANEAASLGIVNEVCEPEELMERARACAQTIAELAPESVRLTKQLLKRTQQDPTSRTLMEVMMEEGELFIDRLKSPEFAEAISAFFEKRKPNF